MNITELKISTSNLEKQLNFYQGLLGLEVKNKTLNEVAFQIGTSTLILSESQVSSPYHFAINIPFALVEEAKMWLKNRVPLLSEGKNEIQDFSDWKAKALYFYDEDKNIVELIGRKDIAYLGGNNFDVNTLLSISEIGIPSQDIEKVYQSLNDILKQKVAIYDGSFHRFCAIGNPQGLFICIDCAKKGTWFPTNDSAKEVSFEITFTENSHHHSLKYSKEKGQFILK